VSEPDEPGLLEVQYGETPVDDDAREFLTERYRNIRTKDELNRAESAGIAGALVWLDRNRFPDPASLLNQGAMRDLHRRMFGAVWTWAGKNRVRETNIGVDPAQITERWEALLQNTLWQIEHDVFPREELGARLHKDMGFIHPFVNGNGRHARLAADELARVLGLGRDFYTWGQRGGGDPAAVRARYLASLQHADATGDYGPVIRFALS
jgi:Fic-DOC domain mobile mystery protein B